MQVTRIEVRIDETFNLGNYSNTKPSITLQADIHPGDDVDAAISELYGKVKAKIEAHIDETLMNDGQSPKFYSGQRVDVYVSNLLRMAAIVPSDNSDDHPEFKEILYAWGPRVWGRCIVKGWPWELARKKIQENMALKQDSLSILAYPFFILEYPFNDEALMVIAERKAEWLKQKEERDELARLKAERAEEQAWRANNPQSDTAADEDDEDGDDEDEGDDNE